MSHPANQLYNYNTWANNQTLNHLETLPTSIFDQKITSVFPSIKEVLVHIYQVNGLWLSVMSGDTFSETMEIIGGLKKKIEDPNLEKIKSLYDELDSQYHAFIAEQDDLDKIMEIAHPSYGKLEISAAEMLRHVVNHGTYHRGNITAMLRQQGHKGIPTDYIIYLYEIK